MPRLQHSLLALAVLPALGFVVACGSSPSPGNSSGSDSGAPGEDSSVTPDTGASSSGSDSGGQADSSSDGGTGGDTGTGGEGGEGGDAQGGNDGDCPPVSTGGFTEAPHGPPPAMAYYGGAIVPSPLVVTLTFQDTPQAAALQSFGASIASTSWFTEVTKDYCIPDGGACITAGPPGLSLPIAANADATYVDYGGAGGVDGGVDGGGMGGGTDLNQFINQQISAAVSANKIPAPNADTIYMFYFPPTTTITGWVGQSCGYGGYHSSQTYTDGTTTIVYAVVADCAPGSPYELDSLTVTGSHELAEAATDPGPNGIVAWYLDSSSYPDAGTTQPEYRNDPWVSLGFGEVGDNCERASPSGWLLNDGGTIVQRIWSASAAAAGHDPCVPVRAGRVYYNASPDKALYVANVGDTFTVDVSAFSDQPRTSWQLDAIDETQTQTGLTDDAGASLSYLKLEWVGGVIRSDGVPALTCVNNGAHAQLKVTLLADPAADMTLQQQQWPEADGIIYSIDASKTTPVIPGGQTHTQFWPFAVVTPATAAKIGAPSSGIINMMRHHRPRPWNRAPQRTAPGFAQATPN